MSIFQKKTINIVEIEPYDISFEELLVRQPNAIFPPNPQISDIVFFSLDYSSLGCI